MHFVQAQCGRRAGASGYTRTVGWKQRVSVVVLVVLAAVPVTRALCAMVCGLSAQTASAHHGQRTTQQCDDTAPSSTGVHIEGVSEHDCRAHGAAVPQLATAMERTGFHVAPALSVPSTPHTTFNSVPAGGPVFENTRPPGWAPPATPPLILRV